MPTHRETLREVSATQLTELTGISPRTVRSRLTESGMKPARMDGRTTWWEPREALPVLYKISGSGTNGESLDLTTERARESKERADKLGLENAVTRGNLLPAETVSWFMTMQATAWKSRLRGLSTKARELMGFSVEQSQTLLGLIDDTLRSLADSDELPEDASESLQRGWQSALTAAELDAQSMGGS